MRYRKATFAIKALIMMVGVMVFFPLIIMLIWNAIMPDIFGLIKISFWQALGLLILGKILFSGFGLGRGFKSSRSQWKSSWQGRWEKMSPEEQKDFYQKYGYHCGWKRKPDAEVSTEDRPM